MNFQDLILTLHRFWADRGCVLHQPYDLEVGAGTFHPATFLRSLGPEPWRAAYPQACRRPTDGRYGENPNRMQHYYQYQVVLKPAPHDIQDLYLESLQQLGIDPKKHDIRFVQDDWESPTLGAWGLGWEVRLDGMEITQFTYFQEIGGIPLQPITGEITYGTERIAMYLQQVDNVYDLTWTDGITYGDVHHRSEVEFSRYNFEEGDVSMLMATFQAFEGEVLYPNPKTSGGAMWDVIAIYGAGLKLAQQRGAGKPAAPEAAEAQALDLLTRIQRNVKVMDKSGRESVTTFERGVGDVIVTYENELLPRLKNQRPYEIIVPPETVWIENPAALVDKYADRHKVTDVAEAFVAFLHGPEAQKAFLELGFRPLDSAAGASAASTFPQPSQLFTIADLGGWDQVSAKLFGARGLWTKVVEDLAKK